MKEELAVEHNNVKAKEAAAQELSAKNDREKKALQHQETLLKNS